jgi:hypothetical protein
MTVTSVNLTPFEKEVRMVAKTFRTLTLATTGPELIIRRLFDQNLINSVT